MMKQSQNIRILVADDHTLFRKGIIRLLKDDSRILVVGEAENGEELINKYFDLLPDIILVDIAMPKVSGTEAVEKIFEKDANVKALFLSMHDGDEYVYRVIKSGGLGLVNKNILDDELLLALDKVYNGEKYFSKWKESDLNQLINDYEANPKNQRAKNVNLNFREEQILRSIVDGVKSKDIADKLNLSKKSIDYYRGTLLRKLELKTQAELIKFGIDYFNKKENKIKKI